MLNKDKLRAAFKLFDLDNNGKITMNEITKVLRGGAAASSTQEAEEWKCIVAEIDKDGDGEISFNEFHEMMLNLLNVNNPSYSNAALNLHLPVYKSNSSS